MGSHPTITQAKLINTKCLTDGHIANFGHLCTPENQCLFQTRNAVSGNYSMGDFRIELAVACRDIGEVNQERNLVAKQYHCEKRQTRVIYHPQTNTPKVQWGVLSPQEASQLAIYITWWRELINSPPHSNRILLQSKDKFRLSLLSFRIPFTLIKPQFMLPLTQFSRSANRNYKRGCEGNKTHNSISLAILMVSAPTLVLVCPPSKNI